MFSRDFLRTQSVSFRSVSVIFGISLLASGSVFAPTMGNADGNWDVVAVQTSSLADDAVAPSGNGLALCTFEGTMSISQSGDVISGTIGLTETGVSSGNGLCADGIGTTLEGTVTGTDLWFDVTPGFLFTLVGVSAEGSDPSLLPSGLNFHGSIMEDTMTGTWDFGHAHAAVGVAQTAPGLGTFTATRTPETVPTLSQWSLGLLLGLLALGGILLIGRSIS